MRLILYEAMKLKHVCAETTSTLLAFTAGLT